MWIIKKNPLSINFERGFIMNTGKKIDISPAKVESSVLFYSSSFFLAL